MSEEKVNIPVAAKALGVTTKTIHRWLASGTLTKIKEGGRTYIPTDEIRALRQKHEETLKNDVSNIFEVMGQNKTIVPIERSHYEGLLTKLGQLENEKKYLLEYKADIEKKDKELVQTKEILIQRDKELSEAEKLLASKNHTMQMAGEKIEKLEAEIERLKNLPWWKRIFLK